MDDAKMDLRLWNFGLIKDKDKGLFMREDLFSKDIDRSNIVKKDKR